MTGEGHPGPSEEEKCTLWVGGFDESKVDQELLYELFINAGPLHSVRIPKSKNYAFVRFEYEESVPYAVQLFQGVSLYGCNLKLQNKALGLGMSSFHNNGHRQQNRPHLHVQPQNLWGNQGMRDQQMSPQGNWQGNAVSSPTTPTRGAGGGFPPNMTPPPFLPPPPMEHSPHQNRNHRNQGSNYMSPPTTPVPVGGGGGGFPPNMTPPPFLPPPPVENSPHQHRNHRSQGSNDYHDRSRSRSAHGDRNDRNRHDNRSRSGGGGGGHWRRR